MAKQRKSVHELRTRQTTIRLTEHERDRLDSIAALNDSSISRVIGRLILSVSDRQLDLQVATNRARTALAMLEQTIAKQRP